MFNNPVFKPVEYSHASSNSFRTEYVPTHLPNQKSDGQYDKIFSSETDLSSRINDSLLNDNQFRVHEFRDNAFKSRIDLEASRILSFANKGDKIIRYGEDDGDTSLINMVSILQKSSHNVERITLGMQQLDALFHKIGDINSSEASGKKTSYTQQDINKHMTMTINEEELKAELRDQVPDLPYHQRLKENLIPPVESQQPKQTPLPIPMPNYEMEKRNYQIQEIKTPPFESGQQNFQNQNRPKIDIYQPPKNSAVISIKSPQNTAQPSLNIYKSPVVQKYLNSEPESNRNSQYIPKANPPLSQVVYKSPTSYNQQSNQTETNLYRQASQGDLYMERQSVQGIRNLTSQQQYSPKPTKTEQDYHNFEQPKYSQDIFSYRSSERERDTQSLYQPKKPYEEFQAPKQYSELQPIHVQLNYLDTEPADSNIHTIAQPKSSLATKQKPQSSITSYTYRSPLLQYTPQPPSENQTYDKNSSTNDIKSPQELSMVQSKKSSNRDSETGQFQNISIPTYTNVNVNGTSSQSNSQNNNQSNSTNIYKLNTNNNYSSNSQSNKQNTNNNNQFEVLEISSPQSLMTERATMTNKVPYNPSGRRIDSNDYLNSVNQTAISPKQHEIFDQQNKNPFNRRQSELHSPNSTQQPDLFSRQSSLAVINKKIFQKPNDPVESLGYNLSNRRASAKQTPKWEKKRYGGDMLNCPNCHQQVTMSEAEGHMRVCGLTTQSKHQQKELVGELIRELNMKLSVVKQNLVQMLSVYRTPPMIVQVISSTLDSIILENTDLQQIQSFMDPLQQSQQFFQQRKDKESLDITMIIQRGILLAEEKMLKVDIIKQQVGEISAIDESNLISELSDIERQAQIEKANLELWKEQHKMMALIQVQDLANMKYLKSEYKQDDQEILSQLRSEWDGGTQDNRSNIQPAATSVISELHYQRDIDQVYNGPIDRLTTAPEDNKKIFYNLAVQAKLNLPHNHKGKSILIQDVYSKALQLRIPQEQWMAFIQKEMNNYR